MKILVFWHTAAVKNWQIIYPGQWWKLQAIGLYAAADKIHVSQVGGGPDDMVAGPVSDPYFRAPQIKKDPKVDFFYHPNRELFEFPTLGRMRAAAVADSEPFYALYFHTKGAGTACHETRSPAFWWKEYMEHYLVSRWRDCVQHLAAGYDLVGCDIRHSPSLHFSGNYFWATSDHLKRLPEMNEYYERHKAARPADHRIAAEMWHGMAQSKMFEMKFNGPWFRSCHPSLGGDGKEHPEGLYRQDMYRYAMTPDLWD